MKLDLTWTLPDNPATPAGLVVEFPEGLEVGDQTFPVEARDGSEMGTCVVENNSAYCDFDPDYLASHPRNLKGNFNVWAKVTQTVTETTDVTWEFSGHKASITIKPSTGGGTCTENCEYAGSTGSKGGSLSGTKGTWVITVPVGADGMLGGELVKVTDNLGDGQSLTSMRLQRAGAMVTSSNGKEAPGSWRDVDESLFTVSGNELSFTAEAGEYYRVLVVSEVTDGLAQQKYSNEADIAVGTTEVVEVTREVVNYGGGASGLGDTVGVFTITKAIEGDAAEVAEAADLTFTGSYTVTPPAGEPVTGTFEVAAGESWDSPEFEAGSTVHLTETTPTGPAGITWGTPEFEDNDFTLVGGEYTELTLTNTATLQSGQFSVVKSVEGDGAGLVPDSTEFVVDYSYPAGAGFEAGSGSLTVLADGAVVSSELLPYGAVVTLSEGELPVVEGVSWGAAVFDQETVTIGADSTVAVSLTNTADEVEVPTVITNPVVEPTQEPTAPALPKTDGGLSGLVLAVAAVIAGGVAIVARRRRS